MPLSSNNLNVYQYYPNQGNVNLDGNFGSKFSNSSNNIQAYQINQNKVNIYQQQPQPNMNMYQYFPQNSGKPQYSINNNPNNITGVKPIYPNNNQGVYYNIGLQGQNGNKQVGNGYYGGYEYGNYGHAGMNQFYGKAEIPKGSIGQFYPNINNNIASI